MTGTEFVRQVMDRLEVTTAAGLAEKMRWKRGTERTVSRWLAGVSEPAFGYTIAMAAKAGMLADATVLFPRPPVDDLGDRLERLAVADAQIQENQEKALFAQQAMLSEMRAIRRELEIARTERQASPKRKAR